MLDFNFSRLPLIAFNLLDKISADVINGINAPGSLTITTWLKVFKNWVKLLSIEFKVAIVLLPNKTGWTAFLEPNNTLPDWIIVVGASILTDSTAFKFTDLIELKKVNDLDLYLILYDLNYILIEVH